MGDVRTVLRVCPHNAAKSVIAGACAVIVAHVRRLIDTGALKFSA
jgi:hypothetical protein